MGGYCANAKARNLEVFKPVRIDVYNFRGLLWHHRKCNSSSLERVLGRHNVFYQLGRDGVCV